MFCLEKSEKTSVEKKGREHIWRWKRCMCRQAGSVEKMDGYSEGRERVYARGESCG